LSTGATNPFQPVATVLVPSSTNSANVLLAGSGDVVLITNATSSLAYVRFGVDLTVVATTGDTPILPNSKILLRCGPMVLSCAIVLNAGSGSVMVTRGDGSST
jgi:hypothetical protein